MFTPDNMQGTPTGASFAMDNGVSMQLPKRLLPVLATVLIVTGCGTVNVTSDPPGATAYAYRAVFSWKWHKKGTTPTQFFRAETRAEQVKVVWPDGVESPVQMYIGSPSTSCSLHFVKGHKAHISTLPRVPSTGERVDTSPVQPGKVRRRWALVIGISEYRDSRVPKLRYASADAKAFHQWLVSDDGGGYDREHVRLLCDVKATCDNIREALFDWLKRPIEEDLVTIYYAGHGSPESPDNLKNLFLLPYDVDYSRLSATAFPMWDIETSLTRFIKAKRVIIIADACHAAGVGQQFDVARRMGRGMKVNPIGKAWTDLTDVGDSVCILSAADASQYSQEGEEWGGGHGVFTYFLIEGLKGAADSNRDGRVVVGELAPYLSEQVRRATGSAQCPRIAGDFDPALTFDD